MQCSRTSVGQSTDSLAAICKSPAITEFVLSSWPYSLMSLSRIWAYLGSIWAQPPVLRHIVPACVLRMFGISNRCLPKSDQLRPKSTKFGRNPSKLADAGPNAPKFGTTLARAKHGQSSTISLRRV